MSLKGAKVLIINAGYPYPAMGAQGRFNETLAAEAEKVLKTKGHEVKVSNLPKGYKVEEEVEKYLWADVIIFQTPTWWFGLPNQAKEYVESVLGAYMGSKAEKGPKKIMVSATFGATEDAVKDPKTAWEAKGAEHTWWPLYASYVYVGFTKLPFVGFHNAFSRHFNIEDHLNKLRAHLDKVFA